MEALHSIGEWGDELDAYGVVCPRRSDELVAELRKIKEKLATWETARLEAHGYQEAATADGVDVSVMINVQVVISAERGLVGDSESHSWIFHTITMRGGWWVCGWDGPGVCEAYELNCKD
jgi:hypothetical protein